jgi:hypothetical protein
MTATLAGKRPLLLEKMWVMSLVAVVVGFGHGVIADTESDYPGRTWGALDHPSSLRPADERNVLLQGAIEQGIVAWRMSERTAMVPFLRLGYKADAEQYSYNNRLSPSVGVKLEIMASEDTVIDIGALGGYDIEFRGKRQAQDGGVSVFVDLVSSWALEDVLSREVTASAPIGLPGSIWAEARYPASFDSLERDSVIFEGGVEQGIDWFELADRSTLNTFIGADWTVDSTDLDYNNRVSIGLGGQVKFGFGRSGLFRVGGGYSVEHNLITGETTDGPVVFARWSTTWDMPIVRHDVP